MAANKFSLVYDSPTQVNTLLDQLRTMFEDADKNNDKVLDEDEFSTLMRKFMPDASQDQLTDLFQAMDTKGTGEIPYLELLETGFFTEFLEQSQTMFRSQMTNRQQTVDVDFGSFDYHSEEMEERFNRMQERINKLQQYKDEVGSAAERKVQELSYQLEIVTEKQHHKELENEALRDELENLRSESEALQEHLSTLKEINSHTQEELEELTRDRENASDLENQMHEYKLKYRTEKSRAESLNEKLSNLIQANASQTSMINSLQGQVRASQRELDRVTQQKFRLEDRLSEMKAKFEAQYQETQEWMQTANDLERELEDTRDDYQNAPNLASSRQGTVRLDVQNELFQMRGDTGREFTENLFDDILDMPAEDSLSQGLQVLDGPDKTPEPNSKAKSNWSRLQTTLQAAQAVKKLKTQKAKSARQLLPPVGVPQFGRHHSDLPRRPQKPPVSDENLPDQIAQLVVDVLLPKLTARIDEKTSGITSDVARVVEQELEAMKLNPKQTDNPFEEIEEPKAVETRTPAPSYADLTDPETKNDIELLDDPFAEVNFDPMGLIPNPKQPPSHQREQSLQLISDDLKSVRTLLEGTNVDRTSQDRLLDQILSEVMSLRSESKQNESSSIDIAPIIESFSNGMDSLQRDVVSANETSMRNLLTEFQKLNAQKEEAASSGCFGMFKSRRAYSRQLDHQESLGQDSVY